MKTSNQNYTNRHRSGEGDRRDDDRRNYNVEPFDEFRGYHYREPEPRNEYGANSYENSRQGHTEYDRGHFSSGRTQNSDYYSSGYRNDERSYPERPNGRTEREQDFQRERDYGYNERSNPRPQNDWQEERNSHYREERNPYFDDRYRDQEFRHDERNSDRYTEPARRESYKGRYYHRHETAQDKADIKRRYEESRRNSGWSSGYLPMTNY